MVVDNHFVIIHRILMSFKANSVIKNEFFGFNIEKIIITDIFFKIFAFFK